jgi:hypothetical protein
MKGNFHVRFLGGKGGAIRPTQPAGKNRQLTDSLEYIPDFTGIEYLIKENGEWDKRIVEDAGIPLPEGSVLPDAMTPGQRDELQAQNERNRIASLSAKEKADEKVKSLASAKTEARVKKEEAEIADEAFDAKAWYQNRKAEIELKYA